MPGKVWFICLISIFGFFTRAHSQTDEFPQIWVDAGDRQRILDNINSYTWASDMKDDLLRRVEATKNSHATNPSTLINSIASIPGARSSHCNMLDKAVEAGILFFLYEDTAYAQLAADIVNHYGEALGVPSYVNCDFLAGEDFFIESRTVFTRYAIAYDFIHDFVRLPSTTVYDKATSARKPFNHEKAQQTSKNFANLVLKNGGLGSNHSILEGGGALYNIICIEDEATREEYFNRFWNGDTRHDAFNGYTLKKFSPQQGMWPESVSYSKGPQSGVLEYMEVIDRFKPELNVISNNLRILSGAFYFEDLKYPNNLEIAAYGDSRRNSIKTDKLYRYVLATATRKNLPEFADRASTALKQTFKETGFNPDINTSYLDWDVPLLLLWGVNFDLSGDIEPYRYRTLTEITHAGVVMQRNYETPDTEMNGLVCYTGGAHYVHSHCSGLDMELYGAGYVMGGVAADMSHPDDRALDINRHYYRIYAGHNTVIVNGTSHGRGQGSWKSDGMLYQNTTVLQASEPRPMEEPVSQTFSFSTQLLEDQVNNCNQQRTISIIRTSPLTAYYIDFFRSNSLDTNLFHDYVYHNIGDELELSGGIDVPFSLDASPDRYPSVDMYYNGALVKFPGWHYFENINTSAPTASSVKATFKLNLNTKRYMHVAMPGNVEREYTSALAPPILEVADGYAQKKARVLTIRQTGEAWDRPFITVFEPSLNETPSVKSVHPIYAREKIIGAEVRSVIPYTAVTDYVFANDTHEEIFVLPGLNISFEGRFGIVRIEKRDDKEQVTLYIGEGKSISFGTDTLLANEKKQGLKIIGELGPIVEKTGTEKKIEIEAEDYDEGGEGVAYHDYDEGNSGGAYREDDVDIAAFPEASNGHAIVTFKGGDWMRYTFEVDSSCNYEMNYIAACRNNDAATVNLYLNDSLLFGGPVPVKRTFDWNVFESNIMPDSVYLEKGVHVLKIAQGASLSNNPDKVVFRHGKVEFITDTTTNIRPYDNPDFGYFLSDIVELQITATIGSVSVSPEQEVYLKGTEVILEATPPEGYQFSGWSGDVTASDNPFTLQLDSSIDITANFTLISGWSESEGLNYKLYPNPSKGNFKVDMPLDTAGKYAVYSSTGVLVENEYFAGPLEFDMGNHPRGIYFLRLTSEMDVTTMKIMLE